MESKRRFMFVEHSRFEKAVHKGGVTSKTLKENYLYSKTSLIETPRNSKHVTFPGFKRRSSVLLMFLIGNTVKI